MRVDLAKLMEKLGVGHVLAPYETQPWLFYNPERGITGSAEVRMGPSGDEVEAELQFLYDEGIQQPPSDPPRAPGMPEQIMRLRATPIVTGEWSPINLWVKGEDYVNKIYDWEEKGCNFFKACAQALQSGEIPNVEELIEKELDDDGSGGGGRGRIGHKAPKIKPAQLLGMKKGM